jgi:hypothetical protein
LIAAIASIGEFTSLDAIVQRASRAFCFNESAETFVRQLGPRLALVWMAPRARECERRGRRAIPMNFLRQTAAELETRSAR